MTSSSGAYKREAQQAASRRPKWLKLRYITVLCVCVWAVYFYWHTQYPQLQQLSAKQANLQQELSAANKQQTDLIQKSKQLQDDHYIARYASEHYNLILPGQVAFDMKH